MKLRVPVKVRPPAWALLLIPLVTGALVMVGGGASSGRWGLHLATGVLGVLAFAAIGAIPEKVVGRVAVFAAVVGAGVIASTLLGTGIEGVRRWHDLGVVRLHPSALFGPPLLIFAAKRMSSRPLLAHVTLASVQVVHVLQPDAGQATAFGAGAIVCTLVAGRGRLRYAWVFAHVAAITVAWLRPDPLAPAPFVEDVIGRAFALGPLFGVLSVLSLAPIVLCPWVVGDESDSLDKQPVLPLSLTVYFVASLIVPALGEFPVPLLGFGASPTLGAFFGLAALRGWRVTPRIP